MKWNVCSKFFKFLRICMSLDRSAASADRPLPRMLCYDCCRQINKIY